MSAAAASTSASASVGGGGGGEVSTWGGSGFVLPFETKWPNATPVRDLLKGSASAMGRSDFSGPLQVLDRHWVGFATLGVSTLLGQAADSPLTRQRAGLSVSAGLAYRWGSRAGSSP